jgi:ELWxxDGT repeat protein
MLQKLGSKKPKNLISILGLSAGAIGLADLAISEADTQNTFVSPSHYQKLDDGTVLLTLTTGENISLSNDQYLIMEDGVLLVVDQLAQAAVSQLPVLGSLRLPNYSDAAPVRSEAGEIIQVSSQNPLWSGDDKAPRLFQEIQIQRFELAQNSDDSSSINNEASGSNVGTGVAAGGFASLAVIASALSASDTGATQTSSESEESTPPSPPSAYLVKDINPDPTIRDGSSAPFDFSPGKFEGGFLGDLLLFSRDDGVNGGELWLSDGTEDGTYMLKDLDPSPVGADDIGSGLPKDFQFFNNKMYFVNDEGIWASDGTSAGTQIAIDFSAMPGNFYFGGKLERVNDKLWFLAGDDTNGFEMWISDGTQAGTEVLKNIAAGAADIIISGGDDVEESDGSKTLFLSISDGTHGFELWISDVTEQGTFLLKDINPTGDSNPTNFTRVSSNEIYFSADNGSSGQELWVTDGTTLGTRLVKDINTTALGVGSDPDGFFVSNGQIYFFADDGVKGRELWTTDGTAQGTQLVVDLNSGAADGFGGGAFGKINGKQLVVADDGSTGWELWATDGSVAGTSLVKNINTTGPNASTTFEEGDTYFQNKILFTADDGVNGQELWITDGTESGTYMLADINETGLGQSSNPSEFAITESGQMAYFVADDGIHGWELWAVS